MQGTDSLVLVGACCGREKVLALRFDGGTSLWNAEMTLGNDSGSTFDTHNEITSLNLLHFFLLSLCEQLASILEFCNSWRWCVSTNHIPCVIIATLSFFIPVPTGCC